MDYRYDNPVKNGGRIGIVAQSCRRDRVLGIFACTNSMNIEYAFAFIQVCINYSRGSLANSKPFLLLIWVVALTTLTAGLNLGEMHPVLDLYWLSYTF